MILFYIVLDVRSLAVASRSRLMSNWRLSNMHIWGGVSVRAEQWRLVTDKVIAIE